MFTPRASRRGSWRRLGASNTASGDPFDTSWRLTELSWRLLESLGGVLGTLGAVLEASWEVLEAYKRRLGGSLGRLGAVLRALEAMLEPSGCQKAPKMEPKRVPNQAPEATRAEYGDTLIFNDSTQDFNDSSSLRPQFFS